MTRVGAAANGCLAAAPERRPISVAAACVLCLAFAFDDPARAVPLLPNAGAASDATEDAGWTPRNLALQPDGSHDAAVAVAPAGGDLEAEERGGRSAMHVAAERADDPAAIDALLAAGEELLALDSDGWTPMARAVVFNRTRAVGDRLIAAHSAVSELADDPASFWRPGLREVVCWFYIPTASAEIRCFYMVVHENAYDFSSPLIAFPVVRFSSRERRAAKSPILELGGGGPGASMGLETDLFHVRTSYKHLAMVSGRDYYVIDPRGVGMAHPRLDCSDLFGPARDDLSTTATASAERETWLSIYRACKARMDDAEHDLSHYNSPAVARDIEMLRRELAVEKWVLVGGSYAARYAQTIVRYFPGTVESMVLFAAAFPDDVDGGFSWVINARAAFETVFSRCQTTGMCDGASLRTRFRRLVDHLNAAPLPIQGVSDSVMDIYGRGYGVEPFVLTGDRLLWLAFDGFYDAGFFAAFPDLVAQLERGETNLLNDSLPAYLSTLLGPSYSNAVAMAHYCAESYPFMDFQRTKREASAVPAYIRDSYGDLTEEDFHADCLIWGVAAVDLIEGQPVATSVPTLFLQGALDPVTPIDALGERLHHFDRHTVLIFGDSSHWGSIYGGCAMRAAARFIERWRLEKADAACVRGRPAAIATTR